MTQTPPRATCDTCLRPVLRDTAGRLLEPHPDPRGLALHLPDGTDLDVPDVLSGRRDGHHLHDCPATPRSEQNGQEVLL